MNTRITSIILICGLFTFTSCEKKVVVQQTDQPVLTPQSKNTVTPQQAQQELPSSANDFINTYYPNVAIANYEVKNEPISGKFYEIKLNNGVDINFKEDGTLEEISDGQGIPTTLIPANIKTYIDQNYKGINVKSLNFEKNKTKVDLLNGIDLEFDTNGNFLRIDP